MYINSIPIMKKQIVLLFSLYFNAVGSNFTSLIWIIIPAISASKSPIIVSFIIGAKMRYASIAPNGSDIPDINV